MPEDSKAVKLVVFMEPREKKDFEERGTFLLQTGINRGRHREVLQREEAPTTQQIL